jgi:hypothetical protein
MRRPRLIELDSPLRPPQRHSITLAHDLVIDVPGEASSIDGDVARA